MIRNFAKKTSMADDGSAGTVGRTRYLAAILFGFNFAKISARACLSVSETDVCVGTSVGQSSCFAFIKFSEEVILLGPGGWCEVVN